LNSNFKQQIHVRVLAAGGARGLRVVVPHGMREQGMPDARCTRGPVCKTGKQSAHEHTGSAEALRHSLRNGSTAYTARSPEYRAFLPPSPYGNWHVGPVGLSAPPQDLTPTTEASGPHDFAVRFGIVRRARRCPLTENRPANTLHARHRRVHRIPSQRSVTMANAPSSGTGWRES
jgi:hypothetical protein